MLGAVEWTTHHLDRLANLRFRTERGGHVESDVDLLIGNVVACMRAGRQIPDATQFALPTRTIGQGYARADVRELVTLLQGWRADWTGAPAPAPEPRAARGPTPLRWTQAQMDWVREKRFRTKRGGYGVDEVDDLLDSVLVAMAHGQRLPDIQGAVFSSTSLRPGYDTVEVDGFLDELMTQRPEDA